MKGLGEIFYGSVKIGVFSTPLSLQKIGCKNTYFCKFELNYVANFIIIGVANSKDRSLSWNGKTDTTKGNNQNGLKDKALLEV